MLALLDMPDSQCVRLLGNLGVDVGRIQAAVLVLAARGTNAGAEHFGLSSSAKQVIELAVDEARRLQRPYVNTEHLMLGLIREDNGIAGTVLRQAGVDLERARAEAATLRAASAPRRPPLILEEPKAADDPYAEYIEDAETEAASAPVTNGTPGTAHPPSPPGLSAPVRDALTRAGAARSSASAPVTPLLLLRALLDAGGVEPLLRRIGLDAAPLRAALAADETEEGE